MRNEEEPKVNRDKFSSVRGGKSYLYEISCAGCQAVLFTYQKDGKGNLIRCYIDRILRAQNVKGLDLTKQQESLAELKALVCLGCNTLIGPAIVYKPESRLAFQMIRGRFSRKPYKAN